MFLSQALNADRSCQRVVNEAVISRLVGGLKPCSTATGGYCKARQRLPLEMIGGLARLSGPLIANKVPPQWRWRQRSVRLIDGSTVTMPDTLSNQARYPQKSAQKEGLGFPIAALSVLPAYPAVPYWMPPLVALAFSGKRADEQTLLRSLLHNFKEGDIVLGDAFYCPCFLLAELQSRGVDLVFEQHGARKRTTDFRTGKSLGSRDHLVTLSKPKMSVNSSSRLVMIGLITSAGRFHCSALKGPKPFLRVL
jgi:hypothetical protein